MRKTYLMLLIAMLVCIGCEWQLKKADKQLAGSSFTIERFDRIESMYLTTGDRSALQQLNTHYPMQTRTLIEDVLQLGQVNDAETNANFFHYFQDSTLQRMITDVGVQYGNIDDITQQLSHALAALREQMPWVEQPIVYTQIGSFDQSIIVGQGTLGISLDKYLGSDYPFYVDNYAPTQRLFMTRKMIVPDCLCFFLLSLYPIPEGCSQPRLHIGKIHWVVNQLLHRTVFYNVDVMAVDNYMQQRSDVDFATLLARQLHYKRKPAGQ